MTKEITVTTTPTPSRTAKLREAWAEVRRAWAEDLEPETAEWGAEWLPDPATLEGDDR